MTIRTRKRIKTMRRPVRQIARKLKQVARKPPVTVYLVRPKGTPAAIERGRRLADEVRKELAALDIESLDETMMRLRGRSWSS